MSKDQKSYKYQVVLSFAGEDRAYVEQVSQFLRSRGVTVFYDNDELVELWGKNLFEHLQDIYQNQSLFAVMFISQHYKKKLWTNHERQAMQARAFQNKQEYILPARFDDTEIPGLLSTVGFIHLNSKSPQDFGKLVVDKILSSGQTIPAESFRKSSVRTHDHANNSLISSVLVLDENNSPITNADVVAVAENGIIIEAKTNSDGKAEFKFPVLREYTLLVAHKNYLSAQYYPWLPSQDISVTLSNEAGAGSIICKSTCYIPNFSGRLNVILDSKRTYLYADNISMNGQSEQPYRFTLEEILELEDANGKFINLQVNFIKGQTSLIQYKER